MGDLWVLLWSQSQCALHIEEAGRMMKANAAAFREDRRMDYVPLHIGSAAECHQWADALRPTLHQRQDSRDEARRAAAK